MKIKKYLLILFILLIISFSGILFVFLNQNKSISTLDQIKEKITENTDNSKPLLNPSALNWEEISSFALWEGRDSQAVVVYKNKIWLMGGVNGATRIISPGNVDYGNAPHFNDVWSSEDGTSWRLISNKAPWGKRRSMQVVDFKGKMFLMGGWGPEIGAKNDVWSSEDGVSWKKETSSASWEKREGHQVVVYKNKIWLTGGVNYSNHKIFNDVWSSEDGVNWKKETGSAPWTARWDHSIAGFNNKLWLVGGMDFEDIYNDVWSSEDGVSWVLVNKNHPFLSRQGFLLMDYKNKLWILGRLNTPQYGNGPNDVWYSEDGINWLKTKDDPRWTGREDFGAVVFKDKMWIIGGMDKDWKWKNDVWCSVSPDN